MPGNPLVAPGESQRSNHQAAGGSASATPSTAAGAVTAITTVVQNLEKEVHDLERELHIRRQKIEQLCDENKHIETFRRDAEEREAEMQALRTETVERQGEVQALKQNIAEREKNIAELRGEIDGMRSAARMPRTGGTETGKEGFTSSQPKEQTSAAEARALWRELAEREEEALRLRQENTRVVELKHRIEEFEITKKRLKSEISHVNGKYARLKADCATKAAEHKKVADDHERLKREIERLKSDMTHLRSENRRLKRQKTELAQTKGMNTKLKNQIERLKAGTEVDVAEARKEERTWRSSQRSTLRSVNRRLAETAAVVRDAIERLGDGDEGGNPQASSSSSIMVVE